MVLSASKLDFVFVFVLFLSLPPRLCTRTMSLTHPAQVYNYLKHMATQVQLDTIKPVSNGTADVNGTDGPHFDPMRRKMYVEIQE